MFLCLLGEVVSYLFYSKRPMEVNWWILPNHISPQRTTKKRRTRKNTQAQVFSVNSAEFLRTPFFKNIFGCCFWIWTWRNQATAHDIPIEQLFSLNDLLQMSLATHQNGHIVTLFRSRLKLKMRQWKISFLNSFKKGNFSKQATVQPHPKHSLSYTTDISQNYFPLSHLHYIHHTKYIQKVDKPMIHEW